MPAVLDNLQAGVRVIEMSREDALYVRNGRPNMIVFTVAGVRYALQHRGNRQDSVALPLEAANDTTISRWLKIGQLEKISKDSFMALGARTVDVLPNEYLKRPVRGLNKSDGNLDVPMVVADKAGGKEQNTAGTLTHIKDGDVQKQVREGVSAKWAGDLMSTEEELEEFTPEHEAEANYPSHHRGDDARKQMGY
jgi:hypothetical protein